MMDGSHPCRDTEKGLWSGWLEVFRCRIHGLHEAGFEQCQLLAPMTKTSSRAVSGFSPYQ
jgi:hypothetical protein